MPRTRPDQVRPLHLVRRSAFGVLRLRRRVLFLQGLRLAPPAREQDSCTHAAGAHQARWDGRNDAGQGATSGVYFVRMVAGSFTQVRKIVMLK